MSYTKGPWVAEFGEAYRVRSVNDMGQIAIMMNLKGAHGLGGRRTGEESAANCRLIAAACFSGWGNAPIENELAVIENRLPAAERHHDIKEQP